MNVESRRQFLRRAASSAWKLTAVTITATLLAGCEEDRPRRRFSPSRRYDDSPPIDPHPLVLAQGTHQPLSNYLMDIESTVDSFIHEGYLEENGVVLSNPRGDNFGLIIRSEPIAGRDLRTVRTLIKGGRTGGQPFGIENRYLPEGNLYERMIISGTFEHSFARPDLIPGQPFGNGRVMDKSLSFDQMVQLPSYLFRFHPTTRWQEPQPIRSSPISPVLSVVRYGRDNLGRQYAVQTFNSLSASLSVRL